MKRKITEPFVEKQIKKFLAPKWQVMSKGELHKLHSRGCDIVLKDIFNKHQARRFFIECKGKSYAKSERSVNAEGWLVALGQIITRMRVIAKNAYLYGLGLPEKGATTALYRIPWQAVRHLGLHIFSVDDGGNVREYLPKDFKKFQKIKKGNKNIKI